MYKSEILEILKTSKKYSKSNFSYDDYNIIYKLGNKVYKIDHYQNIRYYTFSYDNYLDGIEPIKIRLQSNIITEKTLLIGFGKVINAINKFDFLLNKREEYFLKIKPVIISFISKKYDLNLDSCDITWRLKLPQTAVYKKRRWRTVLFNVFNYKITYNIIHDIYMHFTINDDDYNIQFEFNQDANKLILVRKDDEYRKYSKDVTKIIRSERLKKLMLITEENGNI